MAQIIGTPGASAARRGILWVLVPSALMLLPISYSVYLLAYTSSRYGACGLPLGLMVIAAVSYWRRRDLGEFLEDVREGGSWLRGAYGEYRVHEVLSELPDSFAVFHDFHPVGSDGKRARWNVDHIVVGPTGVFVLDAKWRSRVRVRSASKDKYAAKAVEQVERSARELKDKLRAWSAGELERLYVVAVVVYAQEGATLGRLREGHARTLPLSMLNREILTHSEAAIDQEKAGRIARVLYMQLPIDERTVFQPEMDAFGALSKQARYHVRDAQVEAKAAQVQSLQPTPQVCPLCGGKLVRRTARRGERAGKDFLSCENFRRTGCKYGFNLD